MNEIITINELQNDGSQIHLYFNGLVGLYTAYGYSAFNLCKEMALNNAAYSKSMQMPVVVINVNHLGELIGRLDVVTQKNGYYCLMAEKPLCEDDYDEWANKIRTSAVSI